MKKLSINIDGHEYEVSPGQTVFEAARGLGVFIPTLCADGRTEIYGACGMCAVEVEGNPKLVKACATELADGMVIRTGTERVRESRKTMLELLLSDHTGDCRPPCAHACPAHTDCQGYVGLVANGQTEEAYKLIIERIPLPASIGRVCPHPCEEECRRALIEEPVGIAMIKRFCGDAALAADGDANWLPGIPDETGKSVAIIGAGPYGLSLAYFLRLLGHAVTVYEAMPKAGGMLRYGIPEYRLPKAVLEAEVGRLESLGIEIKTGLRVGQDVSFESIRSRFDAVCIGVGAWVSTGTGAKGEDIPGVYGGIELLYKAAGGEDVYLGKSVAVVGGGNTAMDALRTAVRMGAKHVYSVYRRTKNEMPSERIEIEEAGEEGVIFKELTNPIEIIAGPDGRVASIKLQHMKLGDPDASGRRAPVPIEGKTETLAVDTVVLAVGQAVDPSGLGAEGLALTRRNAVVYDEKTFMTSMAGVFAGGDCGNDKVSIAVEAIGDAKKSAPVIDAYLYGGNNAYEPAFTVERDDITERTFEGRERLFRPFAAVLPPDERKRGFAEVASCWDGAESAQEGMRCLECGCGDYFECKLLEYAWMYDVKPERFKGGLSAAGADGALPAPDADADGHPFVEREEGKCILCGLCVRVCEELSGAAALGFADRGFNTVVTPAFGIPLAESGCYSCGLCIDACPTGAMRERLSLKKPVPLDTVVTETICPHCSLGCGIALETYGDMLVKANPSSIGDEKGLICGRGKFGFDCSELADKEFGDRLIAPLIRNVVTGGFDDASWYDSFVAVAKKAYSINASYGSGSVAVSISDRLTNEEAYAAMSLALSLGARVFSFNNRATGAEAVYRASGTEVAYGLYTAPDLAELMHTDYILAVGLDFSQNPVLAMKLKMAAAEGVKIVRVDTAVAGGRAAGDEAGKIGSGIEGAIGSHIAGETINTANDLKLLSGIEAALKGEKASAKAANIAQGLLAAKKAMIVYQRNVLTTEAAAALCRISLLSGHEGAPRGGLLEVLPKCNSRGLRDLEIVATPEDIFDSGFGADVKALLVFGEDPAGQIAAAEAHGAVPGELKAAKKLLSQAKFLAVCDTHMTATAQKADVAIPMAGFASSEGGYTNTDGRLLAVNKAIEAPIPYANWQICMEIAKIAGFASDWESEADIALEMYETVPAYRRAVTGEAQARLEKEAAEELVRAIRPQEAVHTGKLISPLPASDQLTRSINRRLGAAYGG